MQNTNKNIEEASPSENTQKKPSPFDNGFRHLRPTQGSLGFFAHFLMTELANKCKKAFEHARNDGLFSRKRP